VQGNGGGRIGAPTSSCGEGTSPCPPPFPAKAKAPAAPFVGTAETPVQVEKV
jgi:hypothetical protein